MIVIKDSYETTLSLPAWRDPLTLPHEGSDLVLILYQTPYCKCIEAAQPSPNGPLIDKIDSILDFSGSYPEVIGIRGVTHGVPLDPQNEKILKWMTYEDGIANGFDVRTEGQRYMDYLLTK